MAFAEFASMHFAGITWIGGCVDDPLIIEDLPVSLREVLHHQNGFILHHGALHFRGACISPEWHSLRVAWKAPQAFHTSYDRVAATDIPFAQDQFGDQFLLRGSSVIRLLCETGDTELVAERFEDFLQRVEEDIVDFLAVDLGRALSPGQLLQAYPPFCIEADSGKVSIRPVGALEVIAAHADLARELRGVPDGTKVVISPR